MRESRVEDHVPIPVESEMDITGVEGRDKGLGRQLECRICLAGRC